MNYSMRSEQTLQPNINLFRTLDFFLLFLHITHTKQYDTTQHSYETYINKFSSEHLKYKHTPLDIYTLLSYHDQTDHC